MNAPHHLVLVTRIPTVAEVEAVGRTAALSLDSTLIDGARGAIGAPQAGEPSPEDDDSTVREAVERWLDWQM